MESAEPEDVLTKLVGVELGTVIINVVSFCVGRLKGDVPEGGKKLAVDGPSVSIP